MGKKGHKGNTGRKATKTTKKHGLQDLIQGLFDAAKSRGGVEYFYTLVRVAGMGHQRDPLCAIREIVQQSVQINGAEALQPLVRTVIRFKDPFELVINLVRCSQGRPYDMAPLRHLDTGDILHPQPAPPQEVIRTTVKEARAYSNHLADAIAWAFPTSAIAAAVETTPTTDPQNTMAWKRGMEFLATLLDVYHSVRLGFREGRKLYKLPRFEVMELLVDEEEGLDGFRIYFSNGSFAEFVRKPNRTDAVNLLFGDRLGFQVGDLDELRQEWRILDRRLFEVGLPGRYNKYGEWAPLIYPGDTTPFHEEIRQLTDDPEVQGVLFYMMCTGHQVLEFVVRASLDLPGDEVWLFGNRLHLWKCRERQSVMGDNVKIYDGTWQLRSTSVDEISQAISYIGSAVNVIAFTFGASAVWRTKYTNQNHMQGYAQPNADDMGILKQLLEAFPDGKEFEVLTAAIDWYIRGRSNDNVFNRFLCYYVVIESIATAVADGEVSFGLTRPVTTRAERIQRIRELHDELYDANPLKFVQLAYFNGVQSLNDRVRHVCEQVLGANHRYIHLLFDGAGGELSLSQIRGKIAHGGLALLRREDRDLVSSRLHDIENVARALLKRLALSLQPEEDPPSWSGSHRVNYRLDDPRSTQVASRMEIFPTNDWGIRPEWCDD